MKFRIRRCDKHNHNRCLSGKLIHFISTENINDASYCVGPKFESLPETGHCGCGFPQHPQQNVFTVYYIKQRRDW
jgi:hypothetical protein